MLPDTTTHILQLVSTALDEFESAALPATLRRAWRIARLRGDIYEALRFAMELGADDDLSVAEPSAEVVLLRERAEAAYLNGRDVAADPKLLGVDTVEEVTMQPLERLIAIVEPKEYEGELSLASRIERQNKRSIANDVLARIRTDVLQYLMRCESTLRLSASGERIFDRHRGRVDRVLQSLAPEVLDMLNAAIRRSTETEDPEARVHALTSCRRVLVAVADIVFPAQDELYEDSKGVPREVGVAQYRNRILAALEVAGSSTHQRALGASIDEFGERLERLDALTQKGVHHHPTAEDVDFGVIQTYLMAGEVLAVAAPEFA